MFLGHYGVALAAKKVSPRTSLGTLLMAAEFLDLLWPIFLLLGIERVEIDPGNTVVTPLDFVSYPLSHSLLAAAGWAFLFAGVYWMVRRSGVGAFVVWALVLSHWVLDVVVHRPDLPLYPGSTRLYGWGLWNSRGATLLVEGLFYLGGVWSYHRATRARDAVGRYAFRTLIFFLAIIYLMNLFGPPPPNSHYVAVLGLGQWLIVLWAYWVDRHREALP
ncbi:MAG TPA: metal-dependent hydrolase [Terriglobia bacterium]|nr:metal-dependent hydrolase [Terriglobia bacterium]